MGSFASPSLFSTAIKSLVRDSAYLASCSCTSANDSARPATGVRRARRCTTTSPSRTARGCATSGEASRASEQGGEQGKQSESRGLDNSLCASKDVARVGSVRCARAGNPRHLHGAARADEPVAERVALLLPRLRRARSFCGRDVTTRSAEHDHRRVGGARARARSGMVRGTSRQLQPRTRLLLLVCKRLHAARVGDAGAW